MFQGTATNTRPASQLDPTHVRRLLPETTTMAVGSLDRLECHVADEKPYRGIIAVLLFPISNPEEFVSLRYTDDEDKIQEIGVIERLQDFPEEQGNLVRKALSKNYHQQVIRRILSAKCEYGWLLTFKVETNRGAEEFKMRWRHDRAQSYGPGGKVLLDVYENRYIIPDVADLPSKDRRKFMNFIYW